MADDLGSDKIFILQILDTPADGSLVFAEQSGYLSLLQSVVAVQCAHNEIF